MTDPTRSIIYYGGWSLVFWVVMSLAAAWLSGWLSLGKIYRNKNEFTGKRWNFRVAAVGIVSYNIWLTVGANAEGLFLSLPRPFRIGHPPLFVPWSDITMTPYKLMFSQLVRIHFKKAPDVYVTIRRSLALKLTGTGDRPALIPPEI